jgi:hypothetical protein
LIDFQLISFVGCLYKILSKVLANRLRQVVGKVVSETRTTFVKGRQLMDDILIANELVDDAHNMKKKLLFFKVDFEKAYDSGDRKYLDDVMIKMNFPPLWRKWISECITTATTSVLVNESPTYEFSLKDGFFKLTLFLLSCFF